MKVENTLQVVDARNAYFNWNTRQYKRLSEILGDELSQFINLIPFFLQINHKLLPGYISADTPAGVYSYIPDNKTINDALLLNNKFRYQKEAAIKNPVIEALYLQRNLIDKSICFWVFYRSGLNKSQVEELHEKIQNISKWFRSRGYKLDFNCINTGEFKKYVENEKALNKSLYLDMFYSESVFIAGKYPLWWLVPPEKEKEYQAFVEHIKQARFVDNDEFIDLGNVSELIHADLLKAAVNKVQLVKQSAEICLVELLLLDRKNTVWPEPEGLSIRIKKSLYRAIELDPLSVLVDMLREGMDSYPEKSHVLKPVILFSSLKNVSGKLNYEIIDAYIGESYYQQNADPGIDKIISYINLFKSLANEVRMIFSNIVTSYNEKNKINDIDQALDNIAKNMMVFLSENSDSVPLYNNENKSDIILDRVLLRHHINSEKDERWDLVLETNEGQEKIIEGFSSLLGLLSWCWLNRLVNHSTQVSIDCPRQQIKQTEARYVLEILMQQLNPQLLSQIPPEAFENPVRPLQTLLFINLTSKNKLFQVSSKDDPLSFGQNALNLITHCEQLIINSWGDVYTTMYVGDSGILQCICDWMNHTPPDGLSRPQNVLVFGHGTGDSTYMAYRIEQVYKEMLTFFYDAKQESGRFVLRLSGEFYQITVENSLLKSCKIGGVKLFMAYLEAPSDVFHATALEKFAYAEFPLQEIYQSNKENVFQVYFQLINRNCFSWVLDEKGSLWQDVSGIFERESYVTQWLYTFRNLLKRFSAIKQQDQSLPVLEINQVSINQLGGIEFYPVGSEGLKASRNFHDVQINIETLGNVDQLSLVCDGRSFDYKEFKQNVLIECVQYLSSRMVTEGRQPVYVTDIDAPLSLYSVSGRDHMQMSSMLKLKRSFERKINKLLDA